MKIVSNIIRLAIGLTILILLLSKVGLQETFTTLKLANGTYIFFSVITTGLLLLLSGLNIKILVSVLNIKIPLWKTTRYWLYAGLARLFLPSNLGELSLIYFLNQSGSTTGKGSAIFFTDKFVTLISGMVIAGLTFPFFLSLTQVFTIISLFLLFIILAVSFILLLRYLQTNLFKRYFKQIEDLITTLNLLFRQHTRIVVLNFFISCGKWILASISIYFLFLAFAFPISPGLVILLNTATLIFALIPLSLNGLGIRETSAVLLYSRFGTPQHIVTGVYLTGLVIGYLFNLLGFILLLRDRQVWHRFRRYTGENQTENKPEVPGEQS